jgi:anaerobic selenocysteine-containing dehydrogenase
LSGAALAGAAALGCGQKKDPYRIEKPPVPGSRVRAGEEHWVLSTCALCDAGCGIKVRVVEGRAVKIEGNPEHPVNRGGLCSRGQAALQALYHPERVRSPLRRQGERGEGKWKPISWDEAIGEIVAKLAKLRAAGHPERLVLIDGESGTFTHELWTRFLSAFGSPNHIGLGSARAAGVKLAGLYSMGSYGLPAYDLGRARLVLAFGAEQIESSGQTMHFMRAAREPERPRVICVSPRRPGCHFDEWIPIVPGGYGALALSLAHVLVRDGLVDGEFLRDSVSGFSAWRDQAGVEQPGFEVLIRAAYAPDQTQDVTGIAAATVERLAHALAKQRPVAVASDGSATAASNGLATGMAIAALNVLLGNSERGGAARLQRNLPPNWETPTVDAVAVAGSAVPRIDGAGTAACPLGRGRVQAVPAAITQSKPYPVEALFLHGTDPLAALPGRKAWHTALQRVPFLVRFASWLDDSAREADLVLPESLPLEALDVVQPATDSGEPMLGLRQPVVAPLQDTRQAGDVIVALAAGLGGSVGRSLPWKSYADAVAKSLPARLLDSMKEKGAWWVECGDDDLLCKLGLDEPKSERFPTPSRKFEIGSSAVASRMAGFPDAAKAAQAWPCKGLPPWEPPRFSGNPQRFPLQLVLYRSVQFVEDGGAFLSWLSELPLVSGNPWLLRAEINPADAAQLGLADGDQVLVQSSIGSCPAIAQVSDGVCVGAVAMALGESGVADLVVSDEDRWSGVLAWQGTRVCVKKMS